MYIQCIIFFNEKVNLVLKNPQQQQKLLKKTVTKKLLHVFALIEDCCHIQTHILIKSATLHETLRMS